MSSCLVFRLSLLLGLLVILGTSSAGPSAPPNTILFLCPYGGAKSVIAASYFNLLANERGLPLTGVAAATEEPYDRVPSRVAALLAEDGIDVSKFRPRRVQHGDVARALRIVAIDCDLSKTDTGSLLAERWDDVPKVSEDLPGAARAIHGHVQKLAQEMTESRASHCARPDETLEPNDWSSSSVRTCIPP